jgi:hypothetical protein
MDRRADGADNRHQTCELASIQSEIGTAGGPMNLQLNNDEVQVFREMLHDYLPGLRFEVARTDAPEIRHALVVRQALCERLFAELAATSSEGGRRSNA